MASLKSGQITVGLDCRILKGRFSLSVPFSQAQSKANESRRSMISRQRSRSVSMSAGSMASRTTIHPCSLKKATSSGVVSGYGIRLTVSRYRRYRHVLPARSQAVPDDLAVGNQDVEGPTTDGLPVGIHPRPRRHRTLSANGRQLELDRIRPPDLIGGVGLGEVQHPLVVERRPA